MVLSNESMQHTNKALLICCRISKFNIISLDIKKTLLYIVYIWYHCQKSTFIHGVKREYTDSVIEIVKNR